MKQLFILSLVLLSALLNAQPTDSVPLPTAVSIPMFPIQVTVNKTTNLVFPCRIKNVDRGVEDLLVQKVEGAVHILQLKASSPLLPETNLSVITEDLQLYSFSIRYDSNPKVLNHRLLPTSERGGIISSPGEKGKLNEGQIQEDLQKVTSLKSYLRRPFDDKWGMRLRIKGIYIHENVLYLSFQLENQTTLNYDIESLQLFIRDHKKNNRTTTQDILLDMKAAWGDTALIEAGTEQHLVLAIPKFTIPDQKNCIIQLRESNGGRHLECKLRNKELIRARRIE